MIYGIGLRFPERRKQEGGRPPLPPSTRLRTLAWMRFLLDQMPRLEAYALGNRTAPPGWQRRRPDAEALRRFFRDTPPVIHADLLRRRPSLLDCVFGAIEPSLGRWFSDKARRGLTHPEVQRLKRIDDLIPGSAHAFRKEPPGLPPGFYDALDFLSPWYGRLHLWRVIDPSRQDPAWDQLLQDGHAYRGGDKKLTASGFPYGAWRRRFELWQVRPSERRRLRDELVLALAHFAYPDDVETAAEFKPRQVLRAARAACERDPLAPNPIRDSVRTWAEARQWAALTDAMAALRLDEIAAIGEDLAQWWVRSVMEGMSATIEKHERTWFCSMTNDAPPLTTFLANSLLSGRCGGSDLKGPKPGAN
ncbi:MAG: hypothetical protein JSR56_07795 [Proteobacteria bacterium]|nr:hypothetical protein [Pseudomonadota bacterium]